MYTRSKGNVLVSGEVAEMFSNCAIHVFVGAPALMQSIPHIDDGHYCKGRRGEWKERRYICKEQYLHVQGNDYERTDCTRVCGDRTLSLLSSPPRCPVPVASGLFKPLLSTMDSDQNCDWEQKEDARYTGDISDLVSITEHCHISVSNVCKSQDSCEDSNSCASSLETEFFTVWASSQIAAQGHIVRFERDMSFAHNKTESSNHDRCEISADSAAVEIAPQKPEDEYSCNSLELFTQIPDDCSNKPSSLCLQTETCKLNLNGAENSSTCFYESKKDNRDCESTSCKRKKAFTCYLNSQYENICKKAKQSFSPVKPVNKKYDHKRPLRVTTFTPLKLCMNRNTNYNILAVVMQPCHIREIKVNGGTNFGSSFPLATVVVLDQSESLCKVLLWRCAASWSLALYPGDIIMLTNLTVCEDKWNGEISLQSTFKSDLLNLGNWLLISNDRSDIVECTFLEDLLNFISTKQYHLRDFSSSEPQKLDCIQHVRFSQLQPERLVHSVLKVAKIMIHKECTYRFKGLPQNKVILTVEDVKDQCGSLILWGASVSWCSRICHKKNHIWFFKYLLCKKNLISGDLELHTTPWSSCECLFDDDSRAIDFHKRYFENLPPPSKVSSLMAIIEDRYSSMIEIKVTITKIEFHVPGNKIVLMTHKTSLTNILMSLPSVIYSGCGKCRKELKIDSNHLYEQCFSCLPFNQVRTFYKPATMTVLSKNSRICVRVPSEVVETIFLNISPNLLPMLVAESTALTYGAIVADMCHSLLAETGELYLLSMKSQISFDENSIPVEQEFHLLNFYADI